MQKNKLIVILIFVVLIIAVLIPIIISDEAKDTYYAFNLNNLIISVAKSENIGDYYDSDGTAFVKKENVVMDLIRTVKEVNGNNQCILNGGLATGSNFYQNNEFTGDSLPKKEFLIDGLGVTYYAHTIVLTQMINPKQIKLEYNHANVNKEFTPPKMYEYGLCFDDNEDGGGEDDDAVAYLIGCPGDEEYWAVKCNCVGAIYAKTQDHIDSYIAKVAEKFVNCDEIAWPIKWFDQS